MRRSRFDLSTVSLEKSRTGVVLLSLATIGIIAWLHHVSDGQLSMTPLYLIPVAVIAWYIGRTPGRILSVVAGTAQLLASLSTPATTGGLGPALWNAVTVAILSVVVVEVLSRLHVSLDLEHDLARTDPLTGVANTRSFHELAAAELERARRYGRPFTIACLDLDHFKQINDELGHGAGDLLLRDVGHALRSRLRRVDIVARMGGDEFTLLLPETPAGSAVIALEHVRSALAALTSGNASGVTASIGSVTFSSAPATVGEMLRLADTAMYRAKAAGRDRVESITIPEEVDRLDEFEMVALNSFAPQATIPAPAPSEA